MPEAYERLILDVIRGSQTNFVRRWVSSMRYTLSAWLAGGALQRSVFCPKCVVSKCSPCFREGYCICISHLPHPHTYPHPLLLLFPFPLPPVFILSV